MAFNILIVDDSSAIRKILRRVLLQTELTIDQMYEAGDGVEALDKVENNEISLVLSDINMPNMDGLEFLAKLKAGGHSIPVIIISTEGSEPKVMRAVELGARGYVRKPFTSDEIKEKISGCI